MVTQFASLLEAATSAVAIAAPHAADAAHGAAAHAADAGAHDAAQGAEHAKAAIQGVSFQLSRIYALIPFLPLAGFLLCGLCGALKVKSKLPAWITVLLLAVSFALTFSMYGQVHANLGESGHSVIHAFDWINFQWGSDPAQSVVANFSFYVDSLTCLWMLFVTGLATLIALYASEYMSHDVGAGYSRFFAAFSLFVFSMACLVMGDNLALLFLGWEGVGLCSYLLIGYFYKKPSAVAAAKKAFVMNRIGDVGLSLGVMLTYVYFGTIEYETLFQRAQPYLDLAREGRFADIPFLVQLIPILFTVGAFGKSAQIPLYVWLPDAMEGPTPVSALIHAATMVTAGVYLVARMFPIYLASEHALMIVAWGGALTALLAATIGMAQFDIKRIMAYSTVSQLGYMFAGLGVLGAGGGAAHVFTHAFFKAMLFLACGAVMHGFAGQLDLRKLSGLSKMKGWKVVSAAMLVGCINLAGIPFITAGFYSKDTILGDAFANPHTQAIGWILLITAGLTAYYTFRVFFRVFVGPVYYEPGEESHGHEADEEHAAEHAHEGPAHAHAAAEHQDAAIKLGGHSGQTGHNDWHPHPPGWAINLVLAVLAIAAFAVIPLVVSGSAWAFNMVDASTAGVDTGHHYHEKLFGMDAHDAMKIISGIVAIIGVAVAFVLHYMGRTTAARSRADNLLPALGPIPRWAQAKWYVDELYTFLFARPVWVLSHLLAIIDTIIVDGLVNAFGWAPKAVAKSARPMQTGYLHDYALRMAGGIAVLILVLAILSGGLRDLFRKSAPASAPAHATAVVPLTLNASHQEAKP